MEQAAAFAAVTLVACPDDQQRGPANSFTSMLHGSKERKFVSRGGLSSLAHLLRYRQLDGRGR